jgi:hypothetical protein
MEKNKCEEFGPKLPLETGPFIDVGRRRASGQTQAIGHCTAELPGSYL